MSSAIVSDFQLSIKVGQVEAFKAFVNTMIDVTDANEPNTWDYEWFINEDGSECHLLETFRDSDAFMTHLGNVGHMFETLFGFATMTRAKIFGSPSEELQKSLDPLGVEYFGHFNGVTR